MLWGSSWNTIFDNSFEFFRRTFVKLSFSHVTELIQNTFFRQLLMITKLLLDLSSSTSFSRFRNHQREHSTNRKICFYNNLIAGLLIEISVYLRTHWGANEISRLNNSSLFKKSSRAKASGCFNCRGLAQKKGCETRAFSLSLDERVKAGGGEIIDKTNFKNVNEIKVYHESLPFPVRLGCDDGAASSPYFWNLKNPLLWRGMLEFNLIFSIFHTNAETKRSCGGFFKLS